MFFEGAAIVRLLATLPEEEVRVSLKLLIWFSRKDILIIVEGLIGLKKL